MGYSKESILTALTSCSSAGGCDGDWCAEVLEKADPKKIATIKQELSLKVEREINRPILESWYPDYEAIEKQRKLDEARSTRRQRAFWNFVQD